MHLSTPLALLVLAGSSSAQLVQDTLIADINQDPAVVGSYSGGFASNGTLVWFQGVDGTTGEGYRIWATDGTPAGTEQISGLALNDIESVIAPDGRLLVVVDDLGTGVGIWESDGTAAGSAPLLAPMDWTEDPHDLTIFDGDLWFLAGLAGSGTEVWHTDLDTGATGIAFEVLGGPASGAGRLFAGGGTLFVGSVGQSVLWASDGTGASLTQVGTFQSSAGNFAIHAEVGARAVFSVDGFGATRGWWSSDGTAAGTFQIFSTFNTRWAVQADTKVYFTGGPFNGLLLLQETDGTLAGTQPVNLPSTVDGQRVDFDPGFAVGDDLYYGGYSVVSGVGDGIEFYRASGGAAVQLADINPGAADSDPNDFVEFGGDVFFRAEDGVSGREIWVHDPSAGTTELLADLFPGPFAGIVGSSPTLQTSANGVVFGQNFPALGMEPAVTDGNTTGLLVNLGDDGDSDGSGPGHFLRLGSVALFQAFDGAVGGELFATDGTAAGTQLVLDIDPVNSGFPGAYGSFPHHFVEFQGRAVFYAFHTDFGRELWWSDGTAAGTELFVDAVPGPVGSEPLFSAPPVVLGDELFFVAEHTSGDMGLFKADGAGNTTLLMVTDTTGVQGEFVVLAVVNDRVLFNAFTATEGNELWTTDGVTTEILADAIPGAGGTSFFQLAVGTTQAYFPVVIGTDRTLWKTDGTPAGTEQFFSEPTAFVAAPSRFTAVGDTLYFVNGDAAAGVDGGEPWISDGTAAGTHLLADVIPGPLGSNPFELVAAGDRVFFAARSATTLHFQELWMTDGTEAGTVRVADLPSPLSGASIANLWSLGVERRVVFSNVDANGNEWWVSDGTQGGTVPVTDIAPGGKHANPRIGQLVANRLVFAAADGTNGIELHALELSETGGYAATVLGTGCVGSNGVPRLSFGGGAIALGDAFSIDLDAAASSGLAVWFFDFGYGQVPLDGACQLQLALPNLLTATTTDPSGASTLGLNVPNGPALVGATVDFQVLSVDSLVAPFLGLGALSDVLEVVVAQ